MFCYDILPFIKEELSKLTLHMESATVCQMKAIKMCPRYVLVKSAQECSRACFDVLHDNQKDANQFRQTRPGCVLCECICMHTVCLSVCLYVTVY